MHWMRVPLNERSLKYVAQQGSPSLLLVINKYCDKAAVSGYGYLAQYKLSLTRGPRCEYSYVSA